MISRKDLETAHKNARRSSLEGECTVYLCIIASLLEEIADKMGLISDEPDKDKEE